MEPSWLARLERPTTYTELHGLYKEMADAVGVASGDAALEAQLAEAIRRIGRESVHDQKIHDDYEQAYVDFKEKESGVVGWLRRHLPFTETRRKDKEHRADIEDKHAELLGNLQVVARIRLLRASLLSEAERPIGAPAGVWESRLQEAIEGREVRTLAEGLHKLHAHLDAARIWLEDIRTDIEGFAEADFRSEAEQQLHDDDLDAGRRELGERLLDFEEKQELERQTKDGLRQLLHDQLEAGSRAYRELVERDAALAEAGTAGDAVLAHLEELHDALKDTHRHARRVADLEQSPRNFAADYTRLERDIGQAREAVGRAQLASERTQGAAQEADARVRDARDLVSTLQRELRAASESSGMVEADPSAGFDDSALRHAEAALREAERQAQEARRPHDDASRDHREALAAFERLEGEREQLQHEETQRVRDRESALDDLRRADREMQRYADDLSDVLAPYLRQSRALVRLSSLPRLADRLFPSRSSLGDDSPTAQLEAALERSEVMQRHAKEERDALQSDRREAAAERRRLFDAHVQEQLGDELAGVLGDA